MKKKSKQELSLVNVPGEHCWLLVGLQFSFERWSRTLIKSLGFAFLVLASGFVVFFGSIAGSLWDLESVDT